MAQINLTAITLVMFLYLLLLWRLIDDGGVYVSIRLDECIKKLAT